MSRSHPKDTGVPERVQIVPLTRGEFDLVVEVQLIDEDGDWITDLYEADTMEDARSWAETNGYTIVEDEDEFPANFHRLCPSQQVLGEDGESYAIVNVFRVDLDTPEEEIKKWVEDNFPSTYCQHSYDCCGRYYADRGQYWRVPYASRIVTYQTFRLNV